MAERFTEEVQLRPIDIRTGAAAGLRSLAEKLETFKQTETALITTAARRRGEEAARRGVETAAEIELRKEKGITQPPEPKEVPFFFGRIEAQAHNKALRAAYIASLDNDNREAISRIASENPDDLIGFNDAITGYRNGVLKGVDPALRGMIQQDLDSKITTARIKVQSNEIAKQKVEAKETLFSAIEQTGIAAATDARNGDTLSSAENLVKAIDFINESVATGFLSEKEATDQIREINREASEQTLRREFDQVSDGSIQGAFELLEKKRKKVPKGWTPDEWDSYLNSQNAEINRKKSHITKELTVNEKAILQQESLTRGKQFTDPDIPADPARSGQDRKDVNNYFNKISKEWIGLPGVEQVQKIEEFIGNTGIIPDPIISRTSAAMRSGGVDSVVVFSKVVNDLAESGNPSVLRDLPDQARAVALQIKNSTDAGLDIETATEIARKNAYGLTASDKERIKLETQAIRPDLPNILADMLDKHFDPSIIPFIEEPEVNPAIQADFNIAFEQFMTLTDGNSEQATLLASESVRKNWGPNDIDGDYRMQKFAPSVFYSVPGIDDDWMRDQFRADLSPFGDVKNFRLGINLESISSGQPTYPVMGVDENGIITPVFDNEGNLLEWAPDFKATREYKELKALPEKMKREGIELKRKSERLKQILGTEEEKFL